MTKISDERLAEMLAGLEGVTKGPWVSDNDSAVWGLFTEIMENDSRDTVCDTYSGGGTIQDLANAAHIASCDPDTIRSILTELQHLRAHNSDSAEPVAWRSKVNYFGRSGWEYADNEQALIDKGLHNREPLYPTSTLAEPVAVKPLEWHSYCWNSQTTLLAKPWSADCLTYEVKEIVGSGWGLSVALGSFVFYQSKQEAIDAAQSDYERHILDFLVPSHKEPTTWVKWIEQAGAGRTAGFEVVSREEDDAIPVYEHRPLYLASPPAKEVDSDSVTYVLEWTSAPRPPAHSVSMRGRQGFNSIERARKRFQSLAPDSSDVKLTKCVETSTDITAALTNRTPDDEVGNG